MLIKCTSPRKRSVCSASESHSRSMWIVSRNSSAWNNQAQEPEPLCAAEVPDKAAREGSGLNSLAYHRHLEALLKPQRLFFICATLKINWSHDFSNRDVLNVLVEHPEHQFLTPCETGQNRSWQTGQTGFAQAPRCCLTCFKACSSRLCLQTESLHTVSQRVLSSWSCPFTQVVSSRLFSISSRPDRFRTWTVPVRFPSSFWKTWKIGELVRLTNVLNSRSKTKEKVVLSFNSPLTGSICVSFTQIRRWDKWKRSITGCGSERGHMTLDKLLNCGPSFLTCDTGTMLC